MDKGEGGAVMVASPLEEQVPQTGSHIRKRALLVPQMGLLLSPHILD